MINLLENITSILVSTVSTSGMLNKEYTLDLLIFVKKMSLNRPISVQCKNQ